MNRPAVIILCNLRCTMSPTELRLNRSVVLNARSSPVNRLLLKVGKVRHLIELKVTNLAKNFRHRLLHSRACGV